MAAVDCDALLATTVPPQRRSSESDAPTAVSCRSTPLRVIARPTKSAARRPFAAVASDLPRHASMLVDASTQPAPHRSGGPRDGRDGRATRAAALNHVYPIRRAATA